MEEETNYIQWSCQLYDKNIVVLEFGKHYTRFGFAGEPSPRGIIKTAICDSTGTTVHLHTITNERKLQRCLVDFIQKIYFNHLAVSPREKKVVIVESIFCSSMFRNTLTKVFFKQFNVPALIFVPDHLMALATLGISSGIVLDIGSEEAISIAVVDGVTLLDGSQFACLGSRALDGLILDELVKTDDTAKELLNPELVEDIRLKACFVAPFERGAKMTADKLQKSKKIQSLQNQEISIGNCYLLSDQDDNSPAPIQQCIGERIINIPGNLREGACELLFDLYGNEHSLTTMIIETILCAPIDCRKLLAQNIFVIGGLSNLPGLKHRLSEELKNIQKYEKFTKKIPNIFRFHKPICQSNYVSWLGAAHPISWS